MSDKKLVVMRGLPGSGKSTWVRENVRGHAVIVSADLWFEQHGKFDPKLLGRAHAEEQSRAIRAMGEGVPIVVVDNTNCEPWESAVVRAAAEALGYVVETVDLSDAGLTDAELAELSVHGVTPQIVAAMRARAGIAPR